MLFNLLIEDMNPHAAHFYEARPFIFTVHRCALVSHIPLAQQACDPSAPSLALPVRR